MPIRKGLWWVGGYTFAVYAFPLVSRYSRNSCRSKARSVNQTSAMAITATDPAMRTNRAGHSDRLDALAAAIMPGGISRSSG